MARDLPLSTASTTTSASRTQLARSSPKSPNRSHVLATDDRHCRNSVRNGNGYRSPPEYLMQPHAERFLCSVVLVAVDYRRTRPTSRAQARESARQLTRRMQSTTQ